VIPTNEQEIVYLFSRNHEKFGFEKIKNFNPHGTPDCIAIMKGKEVGIEFEYKLNKFFNHYFKAKFSKKIYNYKIVKGKILIYQRNSPRRIMQEFDNKVYEIWDPNKLKISRSLLIPNYSSKEQTPLVIKFKTLSKRIHYIVCWDKNCEFDDDIEIIELKNLKLS